MWLADLRWRVNFEFWQKSDKIFLLVASQKGTVVIWTWHSGSLDITSTVSFRLRQFVWIKNWERFRSSVAHGFNFNWLHWHILIYWYIDYWILIRNPFINKSRSNIFLFRTLEEVLIFFIFFENWLWNIFIVG